MHGCLDLNWTLENKFHKKLNIDTKKYTSLRWVIKYLMKCNNSQYMIICDDTVTHADLRKN